MYLNAWDHREGTRHLHSPSQVTAALGGQEESMSKKSLCEQDTGSKLKSEGEGGKGSELAGNTASIKITLWKKLLLKMTE